MEAIREAAVAGTFYPADPATLRATVHRYLQHQPDNRKSPKALIAPHAGYIYSGSVAGQAYSLLQSSSDTIERVLLLGPSHRVGFRGMAVPTSTAYRTPLGDIPIDSNAIRAILELPNTGFLDQAHQGEHSLEVQLPFLQEVLGTFQLVPVVVGDATREDVARVLASLWGGEETLVVVSSDLSHYHTYDDAIRTDRSTADRIVDLEADLRSDEACGCRPLNGLLHFAKSRNLTVREIELRNSGDTAGPRDRVVGYGAFALMAKTPASEIELTHAQRQRLIQLAREAIRWPLEENGTHPVDLKRFDPGLREKHPTFVTIRADGRLRGCIGSLVAERPLALDVARNAASAAFRDPRFPAVTAADYNNLEVHISVLSPPVLLPVSCREELISRLRPGRDGLIICEGARRATYLPSVWAQLPDPDRFVGELRRKAGLDPAGWNKDTEAWRYGTLEFA